MPFVRMMRMLSAMESGQLSGVALEALLQEPGRAGELQVIVADRSLRKRMLASTATMTSLAGSATGISVAFADAQMLADLMASDAATRELARSAVGKVAVFNSSAALAALPASLIALTNFRNAPGASTLTISAGSSSAVTLPGTVAGGSYLCLGASATSTSAVPVTLNTYVRGTVNPINLTASSGTSGTAVALATALAGPITRTQVGSAGGDQYFRILRCDV